MLLEPNKKRLATVIMSKLDKAMSDEQPVEAEGESDASIALKDAMSKFIDCVHSKEVGAAVEHFETLFQIADAKPHVEAGIELEDL